MNKFLCQKNNIIQRKILNNEKNRVNKIIEFLKNEYLNQKIKENDYKIIKKKYENLFKNREETLLKQKKTLIETRNYLIYQIQEIIKSKTNFFLLNEIRKEINEINIILEKYKII